MAEGIINIQLGINNVGNNNLRCNRCDAVDFSIGEHIYCGVVVDFLLLLVVDDVGILVLVVEATAAA